MSDRQARLIWQLLDLQPCDEVLHLACGHARIANRRAAMGACVTGVDSTPLFLDRARADAADRGVEVEYVEGDMRDLESEARFDAVALVFTAFGYFDDDVNRGVLRQIRKTLKPCGRLWVDVNHLPWLLANFEAEIVTERDGDRMTDRNRYDPLLARTTAQRTVIRGGAELSVEAPRMALVAQA